MASSGFTTHWGLRGGDPVSHSVGNQGSERAGHMPKVTQQVSNSSHATFPTPPPQMPSSKHLPPPTDTLSYPSQAAWTHRGHQGPDAPRTPLPDQPCGWRPPVSEEDVGPGSSCPCTQLSWNRPPEEQHSQPVSCAVASLHLAGHSCTGHSTNVTNTQQHHHHLRTYCVQQSPICTASPELP